MKQHSEQSIEVIKTGILWAPHIFPERMTTNKLLQLDVNMCNSSQPNGCHVTPLLDMCISCSRQDVPVEEDSGADDELEDVLQSLHGLQKLFRQFFSVIHVVLQDFGKFSENTTPHMDQPICLRPGIKPEPAQRLFNSRIGQRGTEMLSDVGLQDWVKVLKLSVGYESNYEHLSVRKRTETYSWKRTPQGSYHRAGRAACLIQYAEKDWELKQDYVGAESHFLSFL